KCSRIATCCARSGDLRMSSTATTCASTWRTSAASSRWTPRARATCSPKRASATASSRSGDCFRTHEGAVVAFDIGHWHDPSTRARWGKGFVTEFLIAFLVYVCILTGLLIGVYLHRVMPPDHMKDDTRQIVNVAIGLVATLAAL